MAQDEGGIHVLTRDPLAVLFYIPAPDTYKAEFTPDSQSINFYTRTLRVETWSITAQSRTEVHEVLLREPCLQSALSFDGKTLACLNAERDLVLLNVATNTLLFTKKQFWIPSLAEASFLMRRALLKDDGEDLEFIKMGFSPDDHYFLAGHRDVQAVYDLTSGRESSLPGSIKDYIASGFAFLGSDRIAVIDRAAPEKSPILRFPSGEHLDQIRLARGLYLRGATRGEYLFVGPMKESPLGILALTTNKIPITFKHNAADVYDSVLVSERRDGEVALYTIGNEEPSATIKLPQARLGKLRAEAVSADLEWVAISNRSRGALWNVFSSVRTQYVRGFEGAWFSQNGVLYADFPKFQQLSRAIGTLSSNGTGGSVAYKLEDIAAKQVGGFLLVQTPKGKNPRWDCDVEAREIGSNKTVWSRHFAHEVPAVALNSIAGTALLGWSLAQPGGHDELQNFPELKSHASNEDYLFEVVNLHADSVAGKVLLKTNKRSLLPEGSVSDGAWLAVSAHGNQIVTFSLTTGEERGQFFGNLPVILGSTNTLAVEKDARELDLYDLNSQQLRRQYVFADPIALKHFSEDGQRLLVLTASQTAYLLDLTASE